MWTRSLIVAAALVATCLTGPAVAAAQETRLDVLVDTGIR